MRTFLLILLSLFPYWTSSQPVWINQSATPQGNTYFIKYSDTKTINPFNPVTNVIFQIPLSRGVSEGRGVFTKLVVNDMIGREITVLINEQMQPGSYNVDWDASSYPSGVYFYKLEAGDFVESKKMVLIK